MDMCCIYSHEIDTMHICLCDLGKLTIYILYTTYTYSVVIMFNILGKIKT